MSERRSTVAESQDPWKQSLGGESLKLFMADRSHLDREAFVAASPFPYLLTDMGPRALEECRVFPIRKRQGQGGGVEVGRVGENDIIIPCPTVSKRHAVFSLEDGSWWITDTSTNGILLGETVIEPAKRTKIEGSPIEISLGPDAKVWFVLPEDLWAFQRGLLQPRTPQPPPPSEPTVKCLLVVKLNGGEVVRKVFDQRDIKIGRDPSCELTLDHAALSRQHALIRREGTVYVASDLGSSNGTLVNGKRIATKPLNPGDQIALGEFVITFHTQRVVDLDRDDVPDKDEYAALGATMQISTGPDNAVLERSAGARAHLVQEPGGVTYTLDKDVFLFGKGAMCDVKTTGLFAPRVAAAIVRGHGGFSIVSLGSIALRNRTTVPDRAFLEKEDVVEVRGLKLVFRLGAPLGGKAMTKSEPGKS